MGMIITNRSKETAKEAPGDVELNRGNLYFKMFYPIVPGVQFFGFFCPLLSLGTICIAFHVLLGFPQGDRDTFVGILNPPHQPSPAETFDLLALGHNGFIITLLVLLSHTWIDLAPYDSCVLK